MRLLPIPLAAAALIAASALFVACGGDSTASTTRAADGVVQSTNPCPERSPSFDWDGSIVNRLPEAITLTAGDYTCDDWSGVSTPGAVLTGKTIEPNRSLDVRLEPRLDRNRQWSMTFAPAAGGVSFGTVRVLLETAFVDPFMEAVGPESYNRSWKTTNGTITAKFVPLNPTDAPDTPTSLLPAASTTMGIAAHKGRVVIVTQSKSS